jgi:hypothetical protein
MSNLYKLTTKCVTMVMQLEVERRDLLAEEQLGTVRGVQGAKEQALANTAINKENGNNLKTAWIDVKKAFDSVDHRYLIRCIERLRLPAWITGFLKGLVEKWQIEIREGGKPILEKKLGRGILQGDSLSPLLFVMCMDPLSRMLNGRYPKVEVALGEAAYSCNHLLFADDLKLMAKDDDTLKKMMAETKEFFGVVGLEINRDKSATNTAACSDDALLIEGAQGYKYLGVIENSRSEVVRETLEKIKAEIRKRAESLCKTKLNAKNFFKAMNEHALSLINYYVGVLKAEPAHYKEIDDEIRNILTKYHIHLIPACKERLYLPREELGRGLHCIEFKSEQMLLQLKTTLEARRSASLRRAAILKVERDNQTHLALIGAFLMSKYGSAEELTRDTLTGLQKARLYSEIDKKTQHSKLYRARANSLVSIAETSTWLRHGNNNPRTESSLCSLQDRNLFRGEVAMCPHCKTTRATVDHLATQCDRMLAHDYKRRHDEALRSIHLQICNTYGIKNCKRIGSHSVNSRIVTDRVEIQVDTRIMTNTKVKHNRPDIFIYDKVKREIVIVEVGITSQDNLPAVENEKERKYDLLAKTVGANYRCGVRIIPYVMTWDGVVTNHHRRHMKELGISTATEAYIQSRVLKMTLESISYDFRRRGAHESDGIGAATELEAESGRACAGDEILV